MTQNDVLNAIRTLDVVFKQYIKDVPEWQRQGERYEIQTEVDQLLRSSFTALPPDTNPQPVTCPRCKGKGTV